MSVRKASKEEHGRLRRFNERKQAYPTLAALRKSYPDKRFEIAKCKRLDQGGFEKGNSHFHVVELAPRATS